MTPLRKQIEGEMKYHYLLLLTYCLLSIKLFAVTSEAPTSGNGTSSTPYEIASYANLLWLSENDAFWGVDTYFKVVGNIDASPSNDNGLGFSPIGNSSTPFKGNFDGGSEEGFLISGLYINRPNEDNIGLFGYINRHNAVIKKVKMSSFSIIGQNNVGAVVGYINNAKEIKKIELLGLGSIVKGGNNVGGVIGYNLKSTVFSINISDLSIEHTNTSTVENIGGVIGYNSNTDENREIYDIQLNDISITSNYNVAGGVIGWADDKTKLEKVDIDGLVLTSSYHGGGVVGKVTNSTLDNLIITNLNLTVSNRYAGGISGKCEGCEIHNSLVFGTIKSKKSVGGIVGDMSKDADNNFSNITNVVAITEIDLISNAEIVGGVIGGQYSNSTLSKSYAVTTVLNRDNLKEEVGGDLGVEVSTLGGVAGVKSDNSTIEYSYYDNTYFSDPTSDDYTGVSGFSTEQFGDINNFEGFKDDNNWEVGTISDYDLNSRIYPTQITRVEGELPVELVYFDLTIKEDNINLEWKTANEINNDYFEIERSFSQKEWEPIAKVKGNGNSSTEHKYQYNDTIENFNGGLIYYRLKQVDFDGQFTYYESSIYINSQREDEMKIYPNFSADHVYIFPTIMSDIFIYNYQGKDVTSNILIEQKGTNFLKVNLSRLSQGWYIIKCRNEVERVYRN